MSMLALLARHAPERRLPAVLWASSGGVLAAATIAIANAATANDRDAASWTFGLMFLLVLGVMYGCQRMAARHLVGAFEDVQRGLRDALADGIRRAPLRTVEQLEGRITRAVGELGVFSIAVEHWAGGVQHLVFLAAITLIVGTISGKALLIWSLAFGVTAWFMIPRLRAMGDVGDAMAEAQGRLGERVEQMLDGFVQVKLDGRTANGLTADMLEATEGLYAEQRRMQTLTIATFNGSVLLVYLFSWGPAAFAAPEGIGLGAVFGYELVSLIELSLGPLFGLLLALPEWARSEAAAREIGATLDLLGAASEPEGPPRAETPGDFEALALRGAEFAYADGDFGVGPIDLDIRRGELVFVTGGNGSGKTTLMKMLLGLYPLTRGRLMVDDQPIAGRRDDYRNRFTSIFTDQHLFTRLYGLEDVPAERVEALLRRFGLDGIVRYAAGAFDRVDLSTGQRMRLAMVVALLEDRPVCVFDEWTANQDPETTWFYYDTLLPELIAAGRTVIAVTHDDRFFDRADLFIALADGRVVEQRRRGTIPLGPPG